MLDPVEINALLKEYAFRSAPGMDQEECLTELWIAYLEARKSYGSFQGCCGLDAYLAFWLEQALRSLRSQRNGRIRVNSTLSLDQPAGENGPSISSLFPSPSGNFVRKVLFWDYIDRLSPPLHQIARQMALGDSPKEIMDGLSMGADQFLYWKGLLRQSLERDYL